MSCKVGHWFHKCVDTLDFGLANVSLGCVNVLQGWVLVDQMFNKVGC